MEAKSVSDANLLFPCRNTEISKLVSIFSLTQWPLVYVSGARGTGKTSIVRHLLSSLKLDHAYIDCFQTYSNKLLFHSLLYAIKKLDKKCKLDADLLDFCRCSNSHEFVLKLEEVVKEKKKFILVFDNAENLLSVDVNLVSVLSNINGLLRDTCPILCLFISSLSFHDFHRNDASIGSPLIVEFGAYSKEQLYHLLKRKVPSGFSQQFYDNYITLTLSVLFQVTNNLTDLEYICESNFSKYVEPIEKCGVNVNDSMKLWRNFESHLRSSVDQCAIKTLNSCPKSHELPFTGKYLLIAAFLASNNAPRTDRRFFLKHQGKIKNIKRRSVFSKSQKVITSPKLFTFERWFHIYKALLELNYDEECDDVYIKEPTVLLFAQIETLITLKLVLRVTSTSCGSMLSSINKYRISDCITNDFMVEVAKTLQFDLIAHMEQFTVK
ncbi:hypothetical protein B4U80_12871 [Leptotrombidium deliense]|uniref:Uncharacterized protein n=1 Tax=Leptotrombidium deliense TaxID=299467 RepID=A0A443SIT2_9ACAR|nr:hypothetical protein B4U80_12871 [Leptotrombidium deliense]